MRHVCSSTKGFEGILNNPPGRWQLTISDANAKPLFDCLSLDSRQTGLFPSLQYPAVHLYKRPTLGLSLEEVSQQCSYISGYHRGLGTGESY